MTPALVGIAVVAGLLVGLSLGALGGGGSILAVPVLVYGLDQTVAQATTGSLVVVGVTSLTAAVTAHRAGNVLLGRGLAFGAVAVGGAALGARASSLVAEPVLLTSFAALMVLAAVTMTVRQVHAHRAHARSGSSAHAGDGAARERVRARLDDPIITFSPTFACQCPRAVKVAVTATVAGLLTGFLGVGGGFLVVPALVLALGLPMAYAAGTSLVVIAIAAAAALAVRAGTGTHPDWTLVLILTVAAVAGGGLGAWAADRVDADKLQVAFTTLLLLVAGYTATRALPALT